MYFHEISRTVINSVCVLFKKQINVNYLSFYGNCEIHVEFVSLHNREQ